MKKAAILLAATMALSLTACKKESGISLQNPGESDSSSVSDSSSDSSSNSSDSDTSKSTLEHFEDLSKIMEADGREYGKVETAEIGETLKNSFFSLRVNDVYRYSTMGNYLPEDGNDFIAVNISIVNISTQSIPVGTYDYSLRWGDGEDEYFEAYSMDGFEMDYPLSYFPDDTNLSVGGSLSGYVFFEAPSDSTELKLEYLEVWDDDFEGNTYYINLGDPEFADDDIKPEDITDGDYITGEMGDVLSTSFFDISATDAYLLTSIGDYTPYSGYVLLAVDMTVYNDTDRSTYAGASDYMVLYDEYEGGELVGYYDYSLDSTDINGDLDFFPEYIDLDSDDSVDGVVIFEIPEDSFNISVYFSEYFDDDTYGSSYEIALGDIDSLPMLGAL